MTADERSELWSLAPYGLARLVGAVRRCGGAGAPYADIAQAIVETLWDAFGDRVTPAIGLVRVHRVRRGVLTLAAARALDDQPHPSAASALLDALAVGAVFAADAAADPLLADERPIVARYSIQAVVGAAAPIARDEGVAVTVYARVAIAPEVAAGFDAVARAAALALAEATDLGADGVAETRAVNLVRLLDATEAAFAATATELTGEADAQRRRGDELAGLLRDERAAGAARLQRTLGAMLNVVEDLREARAQLEQRVAERTRELEHANRAKDEFLAMLGHELRNPLAPIFTALQLMRLRAGDVLARERAVIERQTQHLAALVDDLLDVSRIARGKVDLHPTRVCLADVVAKAVETAAPLFEQQRHELVTSVPRDLVVDGDPARLAQVFANLLTNSAKYTDAGGRVELVAASAGGDIVVAVTDNGRGISADMLARVFDPFAQEHQNLDRSRGGLGLGLAIVRNLVQLHGGRVDAASPGAGLGSTFTVHLPAAVGEVQDEAPSTDAITTSEGAAGRVLVVDDNRDAAATLADLLEVLGYTTRVANDPIEALRLAEEFVPDVAVLDIGLPVMDGYELARKLRDLPPWRGVTLLSLTGYGQEFDRERSREAGFDHHLVKPVDLATLERHLAIGARGA